MRLKISILLIAMLSVGGACEESEDQTRASAPGETVADRSIEDVLRDHTDALMRLDGVVSVGQALCNDTPCIRVGVRAVTDSLRTQIPDSLEGHPVDVHELGTVRPLGDS